MMWSAFLQFLVSQSWQVRLANAPANTAVIIIESTKLDLVFQVHISPLVTAVFCYLSTFNLQTTVHIIFPVAFETCGRVLVHIRGTKTQVTTHIKEEKKIGQTTWKVINALCYNNISNEHITIHKGTAKTGQQSLGVSSQIPLYNSSSFVRIKTALPMRDRAV